MHGIALPVVLMFLLIITISAVYSIRRSTLAEGITLGSISSDSVGFSTTAGTSTLHLYDGTQP